MQDKFTLDYSSSIYKLKQKTAEFERYGIQAKTGAPVTGPLQLVDQLLRVLGMVL